MKSAQPKLSKTSKMPGRSWSLEALKTCPGARENGKIVAACEACYARKGFYHMPSVKASRAHNMEDWKRHDWTDRMIEQVSKEKYFRWFDSGDVYHLNLAYKILAVMQATPDTRHWLPTRQYKFDKFAEVLRQMQALPNVVVRLSSDSVRGLIPLFPVDLPNNSVIVSDTNDVQGFKCEAYTRGGKCGDCRECWNKETTTVSYPIH